MERTEFYNAVERRASLGGQSDAEDATRAVLSALGERLSEDTTQRMGGDLPREIDDHLTDGPSDQRVSYEEFLSRVEDRANRAETGDPETLARAVTETLLEHVDDDEREEVRERLETAEYDGLLEGVDA